MKISMSKLFGLVVVVAALMSPIDARAQSFLRDAETEAFLREITDPILLAAGLTPASVELYLLNDGSLNAFVTGGQKIFIHSGLWIEADNVNQLLGVIAHEAGHISGGHLARGADAYRGAANLSIMSLVLGAAAVLAGSPDAGMAAMMMGQSAAQRNFLSHNRVQESSADQAGATFLEEAGVSGKGLIEFFEKLQQQELMSRVAQDPYVRTHPLNSQRIMMLRNRVEESKTRDTPIRADWQEKFERLKAKLEGYLNTPGTTLRRYPISDQSIAARYARVYAWHSAVELEKAYAEARGLTELEPNNPYFHEILGQILFENGKIEESKEPFARAAELAPDQALILTAYARALIARDHPEGMLEARTILEHAVSLEPDNSFAWFSLARVYAFLDESALASLATAERFFNIGAYRQSVFHARKARQDLPSGSPEWIRAADILAAAEPLAEDMSRRRRR